jgi:hypothetical protein
LNNDQTQPSDSSDDTFLPEDGTLVDDESTNNISPALRALMAKYIIAIVCNTIPSDHLSHHLESTKSRTVAPNQMNPNPHAQKYITRRARTHNSHRSFLNLASSNCNRNQMRQFLSFLICAAQNLRRWVGNGRTVRYPQMMNFALGGGLSLLGRENSCASTTGYVQEPEI